MKIRLVRVLTDTVNRTICVRNMDDENSDGIGEEFSSFCYSLDSKENQSINQQSVQ